MRPQPAHVNFKEVVKTIRENGAFRDFDEPLGDPNALIAEEYHYPTYPGQGSYGSGPMVLQRFKQDLPQKLIDAQRKSFTRALSLYMPQDVVSPWMHQYFAGDFLASDSFRKEIKDMWFPYETSREALDKKLTLDLANSDRKRNDRNLYTNPEIAITQRVCREIPGLVMAVIAYQTSFVEYYSKLAEAISSSQDLDSTECERGAAVAKALAKNWQSNNFVANILPGIALFYYRRNNKQTGAQLTEDDFTQGMQFAYNNGMFRNNVTGPKGDEKRFSCPAKGVIARSSAVETSTEAKTQPMIDIAAESPRSTERQKEREREREREREHDTSKMGTGLFHIYRAVQQKIDVGSYAQNALVGAVRSKIDEAAKYKY